MVPRSKIIALNYEQTYLEILELIKEESHSRMPVYKKNLDNVVGVFHIKDFIKTLVNRRGWYARVLKPGYISKGDPIRHILI